MRYRRLMGAAILSALAVAVPSASQAECVGNQGTNVCADGTHACVYNNVRAYESACAGPQSGTRVGGTDAGGASNGSFHTDHGLYWYAGPNGAFVSGCANASGPVQGYAVAAHACATDGALSTTLPYGDNYAYVTINAACAGIRAPVASVPRPYC